MMTARRATLLVPLVAILLHGATVFFPFVFDDGHLVVRNAFLREPGAPLQAFAHSFWHGTPMEPAYYRPLVVVSFALNGLLSGWNAWGFHLFNVLLHALNAVLVLRLLLRLAVPVGAATVAALLFAVHPAAAWPVASIVARVDLLPAVFVLLAFGALASGRALLTGLCFFGALLSKESAIAFLPIPVLALRAPLRIPPLPWRRRLGCVVASVAAAGLAVAVRLAAGVGPGVARDRIDPITNPMALMADADRLTAALRLSGRYLLYLVAPVRFSDGVGYGAGAAGPGFGDPGVLFGGALLALAAGATLLLLWRRDRCALFLAFALGAFLPAANLLVPISSLYAQNFLYLPLVGASLAIGDLLGRVRLARRAEDRRAGVAWGAAALLALLAAASFVEARTWSSETALFTAWTERFPRYPLGWSRLGVERLEAGDATSAEAPLRRALELAEANAEAHYNLAVALLVAAPNDEAGRAPRVADAVEHARRAAALQPDLIQARVNAAKGLLLLGRPREAEQEARAALGLDAGFTPARLNLAESLFRQERFSEAVEEFRALARLFPADPNVRSPFVVSLLHAGDPGETRREAEAARRDFPDLAWFDFCLARVEARAGNAGAARELLQRVREREPQAEDWIRRVPDFDRMPRGEAPGS